MKVSELITQLQKLPPDAKVLIHDADTHWLFADPFADMWEEFCVIGSINDYGGTLAHDLEEAQDIFK